MMTMTGKVKKETARAVLFAYDSAEATVWLPKSQITVYERAMGHLDQVDLPEWLADEKGISADAEAEGALTVECSECGKTHTFASEAEALASDWMFAGNIVFDGQDGECPNC